MSDSDREIGMHGGTMGLSHKLVRDPTGLIRLPRGSVRVEDPEEEVFLLYTSLSSRRPHDISTVSFPGLGSVDSKQDTITVHFTLPPRSVSKSTASPPRTKRRQGQRQQKEMASPGRTVGGATSSKQALYESVPSALENSDVPHVSRTRKHDKRAKLATGANDWKRSRSSTVPVEGERILEIELVQDKTTLRSKKGDTGSVLWRVSVALGQALLNDFSSDSPYSIFDPDKLRTRNVLELGAGTGLLSLVFAPWVHHYTATDLDYLVPLIRKNIMANLSVVQHALFKNSNRQLVAPGRYPTSLSSSPKISRRTTGRRGSADNVNIGNESSIDTIQVTVEPLDWVELQRLSASPQTRRGSGVTTIPSNNNGNRNAAFRFTHADPPDMIIIADCVYNPALLPALLSAVEYYAEPRRTCVLVAVELRSADVVREFLELWIGLGGWEIWRVGSPPTPVVESRDVDDGENDGDDGDDHARGNNESWLGIDFAVWVGWKL